MSSLKEVTDADSSAGAAMSREGASSTNLHGAIFIGLAVILALVPLAGPGPFVLVVLAQIFCFALFANAFNLMLGYGGLLSFGHAMFFGLSSYVTAHAAKNGLDSLHIWLPWAGTLDIRLGIPPLPPELAILMGTAVAALLGLITGAVAIRRQGIYFSMITLALAQMVYYICLQAPFTGGENGIQGVPRGTAFGFIDLSPDRAVYYAAAVVFLAGSLLIYRIIHSPFGQVLKAIRENEPRAISLGYRAARYKLAVFVLSATLAGMGGGTKAIVAQLASLTDVHWSMSGEVILMTLVGGMGTIFGPMIGAAVIVSIPYISEFGVGVTVVQGTIFVICVLLFREGFVGVLGSALKRPL